MRDLAVRSIDAYVAFFRRYRKEDGVYPNPQQIMSRNYKAGTEFEETFMTVKMELDFSNQSVKFDNDIMDIF